MYIHELRIRNVRGFVDFVLEFSRPDGSLAGWTVVAGRNGAGKSTLLKTIALALAGPTEAKALALSFHSWIRLGESSAEVEALLQPAKEDWDHPLSADTVTLRWQAAYKGAEPDTKGVLGREFAALETRYHEGPWTGPRGWFVAGYGPYRRFTAYAHKSQHIRVGRRKFSSLVTLFRDDASLMESVSWLREVYLRRLEGKQGAVQLEATVLSFLNDGLLPDGVHVERIDSEGLWVSQGDIRLPLHELSDGYQTTAALVLDIVRQLSIQFGGLDVETVEDVLGSYERILHTGIVLIDEADLHLHVSWQQRIGFWLKRHFPNIQFIVTTHSPFICQAADPRGLIRLPAPGEAGPPEHVSETLYNTVVNGSADDAVLTELFGLDSPYSAEAERLRERVAKLEAKLHTGTATPQDRSQLQDLRSRLPQTLTSDVEQVLRKLVAEG